MFGLNSIGSLTKGKGYQTKMYNDATLSLEGNLVPFDFDIELENGWGIMGYLHPECFNTADMMAPIVSNIVIVKDENGNGISLVRDSVANKLGLKGKQSHINVGTIKEAPERLSAREVELFVMSRRGDVKIKVKNAYAVSKSSFKMPNRAKFNGNFEGSEMKFEAVKGEQIGILLGANVPEAFEVKETRKGRDDQPVAIKTKFGWTLFGSENPGHKTDVSASLLRA